MAKRVLIVEDDQDACEICAEHLRGLGYDVPVAHDGMEALFQAKVAPLDLVVLDLGLPKLDGVYLAELWRRDAAMKDVPLLAVSAHLDAHNEARARGAGCVETLAKPFTAPQLAAVVERLLSQPFRPLTG